MLQYIILLSCAAIIIAISLILNFKFYKRTTSFVVLLFGLLSLISTGSIYLHDQTINKNYQTYIKSNYKDKNNNKTRISKTGVATIKRYNTTNKTKDDIRTIKITQTVQKYYPTGKSSIQINHKDYVANNKTKSIKLTTYQVVENKQTNKKTKTINFKSSTTKIVYNLILFVNLILVINCIIIYKKQDLTY